MDQDEKNIIDTVLEPIPKDIQQEQKEKKENLINISKEFISRLSSLIGLKEHIYKNLNLQKNIKIVYQDLNSINSNAEQEIITLQYKFQEALNAFLNRKINFAWVDSETGNIYYSAEAKAIEIYKKGSYKSGEGRFGVNASQVMNQIKKANQLPKEINDEVKNIIEDRQKNYRNIYITSIKRWDKNSPPPKKYEKYNNTFYWWDKRNKKYGHSAVMTRGHISEGYVSLIMNDNSNQLSLTNDFQYNINLYSNYINDHNILNFISGIYQGDVSLNIETGEIISQQFAVKSFDFNTAILGPYIKMAFLILGTDETLLTKNNIEEIFKSSKQGGGFFNYAKKIKKAGIKKAGEAVDGAIQDELKRSGRRQLVGVLSKRLENLSMS